MGIRKRACTLVSSISGATPAKVVIDVNITGRNRPLTPSITASRNDAPFSRRSLMASSNTRLSFTTTPLTAMIPTSDHSVTL